MSKTSTPKSDQKCIAQMFKEMVSPAVFEKAPIYWVNKWKICTHITEPFQLHRITDNHTLHELYADFMTL